MGKTSDLHHTEWTVDGKRYVLPILRLEETSAMRLVKQERPGRPGARQDRLARECRVWALTVWCSEAAEEQKFNEKPLFPDIYRDLQDATFVELPSTLFVPTLGLVQVALRTARGTEEAGRPNEATLTLEFWEDTFDSFGDVALQPATFKASGRRKAEETRFSAEAAGEWGNPFAELRETMAELEGLSNAPGEAIDGLTAKMRGTRRALQSLQDTVARRTDDPLNQPENSKVERLTMETRDTVALAAHERGGRAVYRWFSVPSPMSILDVATATGQDAAKLMTLNSSVGNLLTIPAGVRLRVLAA